MRLWLAFLRRHPGKLLLLATAALFAVLYLAAAGHGWSIHQRLALALLSGRLDLPPQLVDPQHLRDLSWYQGRFYAPFGVLPALVMLPGVALFGLDFPPASAAVALAVAIGYLTYALARRLNFSERDALWVCLGVTLGSPLPYLVLRSTTFDPYLPQLFSLAALLGAIVEHLGKRRWWLAGALVGCSLTARPLTALGAVFFTLAALAAPAKRQRYRNVAAFAAPVALAVALVAGYNAARFGNPLEAGYAYQIVEPTAAAARAKGLLSVRHIPGNLTRALFTGVVPVFAQGSQKTLQFPYLTFSGEGLSWFITFPFLFLFFAIRPTRGERNVRWGLLTAAAITVPLLLAFTTGAHQYGWRFGFDALPFGLAALLSGLHGGIGAAGRLAVGLGGLVNAWLTLPVLLGWLVPR